MNLILFTTTYPFDVHGEQTFLSTEIQFLAKQFDQVILVPEFILGYQLPVPDGVQIETSYAKYYQRNSSSLNTLWMALKSSSFYDEVLSQPTILLSIPKLARLVVFIGRAQIARNWTQTWLQNTNNDIRNCIFYTYWLDQATFGIGLTKQHFPDIKLVSRGHNYDVYEERNTPSYWPCRPMTLANLDRLFLVSQAAIDYLSKKYPNYSTLYELSRLGVRDLGFSSSSSKDDIFRIVSCSSFVPSKRVELLLEGILSAAKSLPNQLFEWRHFGEGEARADLNKKIKSSFPSNARGIMDGYIPNDDLMRYYNDNPVDIFINVSSYEGTPVSIMEAISCGIPVIATAIGGNSEIVKDENGLLLSANPNPEEIARAIQTILDNPQLAAKKREGSCRVSQESYLADTNYLEFAKRLVMIRRGGSI